MASNLSLFSEDNFLCPICLDTFTQPVSTPCGHNFCKSCLSSYWNNERVCRCPVCKETFERRPNLKVNTFIAALASQFSLLHVRDAHAWSAGQRPADSGCAVLCDVCTDTQQEAVKSCFECLTSYCGAHLEPHHRAVGLRAHTLVDPVASLTDRICKEHFRLLALFCMTDKGLLCDACAGSRHGSHDVVPVQDAYREMRELLDATEARVQQMIQERQQKLQVMEESVKLSKRETKDVIANCARELTALVSEVQKSQAELVEVIEEKQRAAEEQAEGFKSTMERELAELRGTETRLKEMKQTEDQLRFLRSFPDGSLLPRATDVSAFSFDRRREIRHTQKSLSGGASQLRKLLDKMSTEVAAFSASDAAAAAALRCLQQYEVSVSLDPDTAHPRLVLSDDGRQVRYGPGSGLRGIQNPSPSMFTKHLAVLGRRGFSSRKFYFEVFAGQKTEWCLGVAAASIQRRAVLARGPHSGLWAVWFLEDKFETFSCPGVAVHSGRVERVGVFVDYDEGQASFYDVQSAALIHSFTDCFFREELYPYLNPCDNEYGSNLDPMVIVPVSRTEAPQTR
ncbi:hypothetical protein F2P81_022506 [Scophthalmus maximus]|uniref:E3 ubiquitin-protein ligase TRIM39-like n=1 Tax=Scophthalmus maximus TaxID=52904 RepID=A0A6A4S063_SCOMX|nr:hypothetical protein F2P81_022506 [Scophthalmus maximus]